MPANLTEALAELQADPPVLTKNKKGHQSKYADLVQVNEQVLSRLSQLGVIYTATPTLLDDGKFVLIYELEHVASKTTKGGRWPLKISENPQQMGSAITYARRYALLAVTGVAAEDEDDDGQAAGHRRTAQRANQQRQQSSQPTAQRAARSGPPLPGETGGITPEQQGRLHAVLREAGLTGRDEALARIAALVERDIASTKDLTAAEATRVIAALGQAA